MKQLYWKKFNEEDQEEDGTPESPGLILSTMGNINPGPNNYEDFNMFTGHTTFYITADIVAFLCLVEGVEALDICSPYRFRIAIGILFDTEKILNYIQEELTKE